MPTAISSKRPKALVPRLRMKVISKQIKIAWMLTTPPSSGLAVIASGRLTPKLSRKRRDSRRCRLRRRRHSCCS
jgi:hypothetical protein